jgi:hypothetical protein
MAFGAEAATRIRSIPPPLVKANMKKPRHFTLKQRAEMVDLIIDEYNKVRKRKNFPKEIVADVLRLFFPDSSFAGRGFFKEVHAIRSRSFRRVLKISNDESTNRDWKVYNRLPRTLRNRYFAKIYWRTKYCLLQKYGRKAKVPAPVLKRLRAFGKQYGLTDIKEANIRKVDGRFKIVDARPFELITHTTQRRRAEQCHADRDDRGGVTSGSGQSRPSQRALLTYCAATKRC